MVWQVDDEGNSSQGQAAAKKLSAVSTASASAASAADTNGFDSFGNMNCSPAPSVASSSIELGHPSPGSGLQTEVSEASGSRQDVLDDTDDESDVTDDETDPDSVLDNKQGSVTPVKTVSRRGDDSLVEVGREVIEEDNLNSIDTIHAGVTAGGLPSHQASFDGGLAGGVWGLDSAVEAVEIERDHSPREDFTQHIEVASQPSGATSSDA